jgi:hypothetical protein
MATVAVWIRIGRSCEFTGPEPHRCRPRAAKLNRRSVFHLRHNVRPGGAGRLWSRLLYWARVSFLHVILTQAKPTPLVTFYSVN